VTVAAEVVGVRRGHADGDGRKRAQIVRCRSVIDLPRDGLGVIDAKVAGLERNVFERRHLANPWLPNPQPFHSNKTGPSSDPSKQHNSHRNSEKEAGAMCPASQRRKTR
jgi:hypothetical protein